MAQKFFVEVVNTCKDRVVRRTRGIKSQAEAERVERGFLINMNRDSYHTRIVDEKGNEV